MDVKNLELSLLEEKNVSEVKELLKKAYTLEDKDEISSYIEKSINSHFFYAGDVVIVSKYQKNVLGAYALPALYTGFIPIIGPRGRFAVKEPGKGVGSAMLKMLEKIIGQTAFQGNFNKIIHQEIFTGYGDLFKNAGYACINQTDEHRVYSKSIPAKKYILTTSEQQIVDKILYK